MPYNRQQLGHMNPEKLQTLSKLWLKRDSHNSAVLNKVSESYKKCLSYGFRKTLFQQLFVLQIS